jgi:hypothetical protein
VLGAVLAALEGGPRVVLVEPEAEFAAAWVAWVSYALPADLAAALTFSTFAGQPRHAADVQLCVTTPGCDLDFAAHELGREVVLLEVDGEAPASAARNLYARVADALAAEGPDALATGARTASEGTVARRGAQLAIRSGRVGLALEEHAAAVLELVDELARGGQWQAALQTARELPADPATAEALQAWASVHRSARAATAESARELADEALERLIRRLVGSPDAFEPVAADSPTSPSPGVLARWLEQLEGAGGAQRAALLDGGLRLGLVGCNVALDRRVARAFGEAIEDDDVARLLARLATEQRDPELVEQVVAGLARAAFADERALPRLRRAIADPALAETTRLLAVRAEDFDERAVWERLRVETDPARLPDALAALVPIAVRAERCGEVRTLFGERGPVSIAEHALLMRAFVQAAATACDEDIDAALASLAGAPLGEDEQGRELTRTLARAAPIERLRREPLFLAWQAAVRSERPAAFAEWCEWVACAARTPSPYFPHERWLELCSLAGRVAVEALDFDAMLRGPRSREADRRLAPRAPTPPDPADEYAIGLQRLADGFRERWAQSVSEALERRLGRGRGRERAWFGAQAFIIFERLPPQAGRLLETALAPVVEQLSSRRLQAIEELLDEDQLRNWQLWLERHPPRAGVGETVSRLLRREGR